MKILYTSLAAITLLGGLAAQVKTFSMEFREAKLTEVISEIGKLTGVRIFVEDSIKADPFTSSFADSTAENAVSVL